MDPGGESAGEATLPELTTTVLPSNGQVCGGTESRERGRCALRVHVYTFAVRRENWLWTRVAVDGTRTSHRCVHVTFVGLRA